MYSKRLKILAVSALVLLLSACATQWRKLDALYGDKQVDLPSLMGKDATSSVPEIERIKTARDTLKVIDDETGKELIFMKTLIDERTGEAVASEVLDAATITARFRNISERNGEVDLYFDIIVPASVRDSRWQVQVFPYLYALGDSTRLDPVVITGQAYRNEQLRGYERYEKLVASLITDPSHYYERRNFEIFLARNLPEIYALRGDTTRLSASAFQTIYGLSEQDILDHYAHKARLERNYRERARHARMHDQLAATYSGEGIRLDTVLVNENGTFVYEYMHTVHTKKGLRKVDVALGGEVLEHGEVIYRIPRSDPYTFYISSTSTLAAGGDKYLQKIVERRVAANLNMEVEFAPGSSRVDPSRGKNAHQLSWARKLLSSLLQDKEYDVDSIVVSAFCSPDGSVEVNNRLSKKRGESISDYFTDYVRAQQDSLEEAVGVVIDENGLAHRYQRKYVIFMSRSVGEDWETLDELVRKDEQLTESQKADYMEYRTTIKDPDRRDWLMHKMDGYRYIHDNLYTKLRRVDFDFYLQRKDMAKDTVVTTVVDTVYRRGMEALRDMDYKTAATILAPYQDYNTAVAAVGADRNYFALEILNQLEPTPQVHYLLAIVHSRLGDDQSALEHYITACKLDHSMVFRGNLDPEISRLIKLYGLNRQDEDEDIY